MAVRALYPEGLVLHDFHASWKLHLLMAKRTCRGGVRAFQRKAGHGVVAEGRSFPGIKGWVTGAAIRDPVFLKLASMSVAVAGDAFQSRPAVFPHLRRPVLQLHMAVITGRSSMRSQEVIARPSLVVEGTNRKRIQSGAVAKGAVPSTHFVLKLPSVRIIMAVLAGVRRPHELP